MKDREASKDDMDPIMYTSTSIIRSFFEEADQ